MKGSPYAPKKNPILEFSFLHVFFASKPQELYKPPAFVLILLLCVTVVFVLCIFDNKS